MVHTESPAIGQERPREHGPAEIIERGLVFDVRVAARSAAFLFFSAIPMLAAALPFEMEAPRLVTVAIVAVVAVLAGMGLLLAERAGRASLSLVYATGIAGLLAIAVLVAASGGSTSPFAPYYLVVIVHAAAFQSRVRLIGLVGLAIALFLAPLAYDDVGNAFPSLAVICIPATVVVAVLTYVAVGALRTERRRAAVREAEALQAAEHDELTGVGNYRLFWRQLQSETARARRYSEPFSLIVLDLDGFKAINDELGHQAGDEALRMVASALGETVREEDVLCRQGGDEFAVIAVRAGEEEATELAGRLVEAVAGATGPSTPLRLAASAGWATFGAPESTADGVLAQADEALRAAKREQPDTERGRALGAGPGARVPRLAVLSAFARSLALAPGEESILQAAVGHAVAALDVSLVEIWRRGPEPGQVILCARGGALRARPAPGEAVRIPPKVEDAMADGRLATLESDDPDSPISGLIVPILFDGRTWGVLRVCSECVHVFGSDERRLALAMAAQIGRALSADARRGELQGAVDAGGVAQSVDSDEAERVAELAVAVGRALDISEEELEMLGVAALLHDVGMVGVPAGLPLRPSPLSAAEVAVVREHPVIGERLLRPLPELRRAASIVRHQHENFDGTGCPDGLADDDIPCAARVLHAAVAWVAMTSPRPYRAPLSDEQARAELRGVTGSQLDPQVVDALLELTSQPSLA